MGDKLTQAERDYLRTRASQKCISETNNTFKSFEDASIQRLRAYDTGKAWRYDYKKDTTVVETSYVYVWRVDPPFVYFRVRLNNAGTVSNQFWKFDLDANTDMIRNLQEQSCAKTLTLSLGTTAMTALNKTSRVREDASTLAESSTDHRLSTSFPAYFAALNLKRTKKLYDNNGKLTKTEVYDYTLTGIADVDQPSSYTDSAIVNRSYCVPEFTSATGSDTRDNFVFPFESVCETNDAGTVDANGDGTPDFEPATEL
jgi:hypothetical protein